MAESKNSGMVKMYVIVTLNYKRSKMGNQQPNSKSKVFKNINTFDMSPVQRLDGNG
jgi:hypothetical protein